MIRPIFLVIADHIGPVPNPQKDQSETKKELTEGSDGIEYPLSTKAVVRYPKEDHGVSDGVRFARKFHLESKEIAIALANDLAKKHPGKVYYVLETTFAFKSSVQEPESLPLADAA